MSKRESFLRYSLIINKIQKENVTFDQISGYLDRESELQGYNLRVSKRTFQRDLDEIRSLFNVDIQFDFSKKRYFISEDLRNDSNSRMLESFDLFNVLNLTNDLSQFIHFEKRKPKGTEHFCGLLHCIKNKTIVKLSYFKFEDDKVIYRTVEPYLLKEFKERWYILAKDQYDGYIKTFGLDRIHELEVTKKRFNWPLSLNPREMFKDCFGIIRPSKSQPKIIVLSFAPYQGKYIKTFPLHETQEIIIDNKTETRIRLKLYITYDFIMELLSFGDQLRIISPTILKKKLCISCQNSLALYKPKANF